MLFNVIPFTKHTWHTIPKALCEALYSHYELFVPAHGLVLSANSSNPLSNPSFPDYMTVFRTLHTWVHTSFW